MRYLLLFMLLVGIFVLGRDNCHGKFFKFNAVKGEGPVKSETRNLSGFSSLESDLVADISVYYSNESRVEISAQENLLPILKSEVRNKILYLESDENINADEPVRIKLYTNALDGIGLQGAGNLAVQDSFGGEHLDVRMSGVVNLTFPRAHYRTVDCALSGGGGIAIGGRAEKLNADVSGVGKIEALDLAVEDCEANMSGAGSIECNVAGVLNANISGVGSVRYRDEPREKKTQISGAGSVKRIGSD